MVSLILLLGCQSQKEVSEIPLTYINNNTEVITSNQLDESGDTQDKDSKDEAGEVIDLWQRVRDGLAMDIYHSNKTMEESVKWYKNNQYYFTSVTTRAEPYLHFIIEEAESRNLPLELALMPVIESTFDPFAYSHAGAAGLWQIMPTTAEHFGLKQSWWYDGRRDIVASTRMALDYMQALYRTFGDWKLALAAYNSGPGRVQRAVKKNARKNIPTTFWHLDLPRETKNYVSKLLALKKIVRNPEQYGINLPYIANIPFFEIVDITGQLDIGNAAKIIDTPVETLYKLNPGLNRWSTPPEGPHYLSIPFDKAEIFKNKLQEIPANMRIQWRRYTVRAGDNLNSLAKTFKIDVAMISDINRLDSSIIRIGKTLLIPSLAKNANMHSLSPSQMQRARQKRVVTDRRKQVHIIKPGDSLWSISKQYKVDTDTLARWNNISPSDILQINQKLIVWVKDSNKNNKVTRKVHYKVKDGDSLYDIANKFNIEVDEIKDINSLDEKYIHPGQQLILYVNVARSYD